MEKVLRTGRREFVASALAGLAAGAVGESANAASERANRREFYEIRAYRFLNAETQERFGRHLQDALIPALKRAGVGPVGVFAQEDPPLPAPSLYVLLPLPTLDAVTDLPARLEADAEYKRAGAPLFSPAIADAPYAAYESRLLRAFKTAPKIKLPPESLAGKGRRFQLRTYVSPNEGAGFKKIEMFEGGEMAMFVRAGLQPVFYAQGLVGTDLPSLTYMLTFPDGIEPKTLWAKWSADPEYKRLFSLPEYQGIVTRVVAPMLRPTPYSQI